MKLLRNMKNNRGIIIGFAAGVLVILIVYFLYLLKQVEVAFESPSEFIPTRIYSNVTRVSPPMAREVVEQKLRALGYSPQRTDETLIFTLHSPQYPDFLIPENDPTHQLKDKRITLRFDGASPSSPLQAIESEGAQYNDVYLEPEFVATLNSDKSQIREVLKFEDFPSTIPDAVMAAEDNHFYEHFGIDPRGFIRAILVDIKTLSLSQGGSTITQQLVKNLMERRNRNLFMKANELFLAPVLELKYSKHQIFERYLNEVFLGQIGSYEIRGFSEGAKYFFGKNVKDLNTGEVAMLVGLIKGPAFYSPYRHFERAKTRQQYVLERMLETKKITEAQFQAATKAPIRLAQAPAAANRAPYFVDYVKAELVKLLSDRFDEKEIPELGFQIYTTMDLNINQTAQQALQNGLQDLEQRLGITPKTDSKAAPQGTPNPQQPRLQGAVAVADQTTGEIRALIGGRNYGESTFNRILNMKRQVGSTFKPVVYATAFRQIEDHKGNTYTPAYPLLDEEWAWKYDPSQPVWKPTNYEKEKLGWLPLKTALAKSINTTAARVAKDVGLTNIAETAKMLGIHSRIPQIPSIALGSMELSPIEVLEAYLTFANHGKADSPYVIRAIQNPDGSEFLRSEYRPQQRIDAGIADMMTYLLQDVFVEGTASPYAYDRPAAGKTGTTNDYRDSWFVGYTPQLTALVWVGLDQGVINQPAKPGKKARPIHLTGASGALPIWLNLMRKTLAYEPALPFAESDNLQDVRLDIKSGQKAESSCSEGQVVTEKVIVGREPRKSTCLSDYPKDVD